MLALTRGFGELVEQGRVDEVFRLGLLGFRFFVAEKVERRLESFQGWVGQRAKQRQTGVVAVILNHVVLGAHVF